MNDIELYWNGFGYGIAYSDSMDLYGMERHLIDCGYVITMVDGGYIHFYDPKEAERWYDQEAPSGWTQDGGEGGGAA